MIGIYMGYLWDNGQYDTAMIRRREESKLVKR
jgi:hypothetical protein